MNVGDDLATCYFLNKKSGALEGVDDAFGIGATLVAEAGVGAELMAASRLADGNGIEPCALDEGALGGVADAAVETAEHAGDAHWLLGVAYHEVISTELALLTIESYERGTLLTIAHDDCLPLDLIGIESVERLSETEEDVVGDVDNVVDGVEPDGFERLLEPFGGLFNRHAIDEDAAVTRASLSVLDIDLNALLMVIGLVAIDGGACE